MGPIQIGCLNERLAQIDRRVKERLAREREALILKNGLKALRLARQQSKVSSATKSSRFGASEISLKPQFQPSSAMLDVQARLLDLIKANPGITTSRLYGSAATAESPLQPGRFWSHLRHLITSGDVVQVQRGYFWPRGVIPKKRYVKRIGDAETKSWTPSGFIREPSLQRLMAGR